jgi:hypothetical protein
MIRQRACAPADIFCRRDRAVVTTCERAGIRPAARPRRHFSAGNRNRRRQVGNTAFLFAAKSADVEVMLLLVENGADPKMNTLLNVTPLMLTAGIAWAAYQDTATGEQVLEAVKYLVEELGADVSFAALDVVDKIGRTPLKVAEGVEYGNSFQAQPHTAELLRKLGAKQIACPGLCSNIIPEEALPPEEPVK